MSDEGSPDDPPTTGERVGDDRSTDPFESLPDADGENPFESLDGASLGERTPASEPDLFQEIEVDADVTEAPWEELVSADGPLDSGPDGVDPTTVGEVVVPKQRYCQQCDHFTDPPDVACTHPDGRILEVTDVDHFRVRNCPVVAYRREHAAYDGPEVEADD